MYGGKCKHYASSTIKQKADHADEAGGIMMMKKNLGELITRWYFRIPARGFADKALAQTCADRSRQNQPPNPVTLISDLLPAISKQAAQERLGKVFSQYASEVSLRIRDGAAWVHFTGTFSAEGGAKRGELTDDMVVCASCARA